MLLTIATNIWFKLIEDWMNLQQFLFDYPIEYRRYGQFFNAIRLAVDIWLCDWKPQFIHHSLLIRARVQIRLHFSIEWRKKTTSHFSWIFFKTSIATDMHIIVRNVWWNRNGFHLNACIAWEKKTSMVSKHLWSISVVHQHLMANKIVKQCWLNSSEDWTVTNTNNNYFKLFMIRNLPNESSPLFSMLNLIVLGIETRLVVALSVFFFFGFSKSA